MAEKNPNEIAREVANDLIEMDSEGAIDLNNWPAAKEFLFAQANQKEELATAGELIIEHALEEIFPLPDKADPRWVEGKLAGYAAAMDAIGFDYTAKKDAA